MNKLLARTLIAAALALGTSLVSTGAIAADAPAAAPVTDEALAAAVKTALDADPELKAFNLVVASKKGEVSIDGSVDHGVQMAQAGQIAEKVPGVKYVINNITPKD